ncbi:MAG TPA: DUF4389 domain-containing protein [Acidimicrobiales bacterium]
MSIDPAIGGPAGRTYPARFSVDPAEEVARWRPLVNWLLAVPHLAVVQALQAVAQALSVVSWFAILFTGRVPSGVAEFQAMYVRYALRTATFVGFLREEYPPFAFATTTADPGDDPRTRVDVVPDTGERDRVSVAFRLILAIPHLLVLAALAVALVVVAVIGAVVVIVTGAWPPGLRDFAVGVGRWWLRVEAYLLLLTDEYPPFTLDDVPAPPAAAPGVA